MRKYLHQVPLAMCILYIFYPLMYLLGERFKFGYELRNPVFSSALMAAVSIAAVVLLMKEKPNYRRIDRIALVLMLPLSCVHAFFMMIGVDSRFTLVMLAISIIACCVLFFRHTFRNWYTFFIGLVSLPLLAFTLFFLFIAGFMVGFGNTELIRSYEADDHVSYVYYVDEGALGESWYTDVYSKDCCELIFGRFYPYYERIHSSLPM